MSHWGNAHTHSNFSVLDGMTTVSRLVEKAHDNGNPFIALTDHGNMAGTVQLYKAARKFDIAPFPGVEAYLIDPNYNGSLEDSSKVARFHLGLLALDLKGYQALIKFVSKTHTRPRFNRFPRCTLGDLAELAKEAGKHIALTTGCFFGFVQQTLIHDGDDEALRIVKMLATWFPHTFVEVQNHSIEHDEDDTIEVTTDDVIVEALVDVAARAGLPVIATQDSHYCDQNEKAAHALMKRMVYGGAEDEFPGDSFHLASSEWVAEHYRDSVWAQVEDACEHLLSLNKLSIPPLDDFKVHVPQIENKPNTMLKRECVKALDQYITDNGLERKRGAYVDRFRTEFEVIKKLGMANYFLFMLEGVNWCRRKKITIEARGSANGSLVCFLLGITQVDPIKWGTVFERFLSEDRIHPPDIDMDIEDIGRPMILGFLAKNYDTLQIGTFAELGARAEDQKGSVMASYIQYLRRQCIDEEKEKERKRAEREERKPVLGKAEEQGKALFRQRYGWVQSLDDVRKLNAKDWIGLKRMAAMKSVRKSYGVHASGVLVSGSDMAISDWVPSMLVASSNTHVTQFDMDDVEEFGLLKADWLGQKTLRIMRRAQELIGEQEDPSYFGWIPENDADACRLLREGRENNGIFHFEGYTKAKGGKEMGIKNTKDAIVATALYMPGATESGQKDVYLNARRDKEWRDILLGNYRDIHPVFESVLKETHGAVLYQEQSLNILRGLNIDIGTVNKMFKVVKDSGKGAVERNRERLNEMRDLFDQYAIKAGVAKSDLDEAWRLTTGFLNYGFNKNHATGYGLRSYRCAYLKAHYPLEFMTALLECWAGDTKEKSYIQEARRIGIRLMPPDVNVSGSTWTMDRKRNAIRKGLSSIAGIGPAAAEEIASHAPYKSVLDIAKRCNPKKVTGGKAFLDQGTLIGTLRKLEDVGALDSIEH